VIIDESIDDYFEDAGHANIRLFKRFWVEEGTVLVYDVEPVHVKGGMHIGAFYLVTFDDMSSEQAFGIGPSPKEALENAKEQWDKYAEENDNENPFKEVLRELQEGGE
jgi:predicted RNase H-like HicB family nuclease